MVLKICIPTQERGNEPKEKVLPFEMRVPNALTAETLAKSERGEDVHHAMNADDLFSQLGI